MKIVDTLVSLLASSGLSSHENNNVGIQVHCEGIQQGALSAKALAYSAKAVETTYNSIYEVIDGEILQHVAATGIVGKGGGCKNCGDDMVWETADEKVHDAWESLFLARLLEDSTHFKSVKNCMITMNKSSDVAVQIE